MKKEITSETPSKTTLKGSAALGLYILASATSSYAISMLIGSRVLEETTDYNYGAFTESHGALAGKVGALAGALSTPALYAFMRYAPKSSGIKCTISDGINCDDFTLGKYLKTNLIYMLVATMQMAMPYAATHILRHGDNANELGEKAIYSALTGGGILFLPLTCCLACVVGCAALCCPDTIERMSNGSGDDEEGDKLIVNAGDTDAERGQAEVITVEPSAPLVNLGMGYSAV